MQAGTSMSADISKEDQVLYNNNIFRSKQTSSHLLRSVSRSNICIVIENLYNLLYIHAHTQQQSISTPLKYQKMKIVLLASTCANYADYQR